MNLRICLAAAALMQTGQALADLDLEVSSGIARNRDAHLVLLGYEQPAARLFGQQSWVEVNVGGWDGVVSSGIAGIARGVQWPVSVHSALRLSSGGSLISETNNRVSTAFQFYEQLAWEHRARSLGVGMSWRHWSNANIKKPNYGMDFISGWLQYHW